MFCYTCHGSRFRPWGICTDVLGHILVYENVSSTVNMLDQDGRFLGSPRCVCGWREQSLCWTNHTNTVIVHKYLQWSLIEICLLSIVIVAFSRIAEHNSTKLGTKHLWVKGIKFCSNGGPHPFSMRVNNEIDKIWKSSPEPLAQFQTNIAQSMLGWSFFSNEGPCSLSRGDNYKIAKIHWQNLKIFFSRTIETISTKQTNKMLVFTNKDNFQKKDKFLINVMLPMCLLFNNVWKDFKIFFNVCIWLWSIFERQ